MRARTADSSDSLKESRAFLTGEWFPRSRYQSVKCHMHDPDTMQIEHPITQHLAHAPNLSIATFGEDDAESRGTDALNPAGSSRMVENVNPLSHAIDE
jgi:hypothetical protein